MPGGSSYTNVFGGVAIRPAQPSYLALTISENTALVWPLETTEGQPVVAATLDITATTTSLQLLMPPGNTGSVGSQSVISNVGSDTFTVTDQAGNPITPIATTETWLIVLTDNTTDNGTWRAIQIGATVSQATAAALAGLGLQVAGSMLQINWPTTNISTSGTVGANARSTLLNWTGTSGTLQLAGHATLGVGFICAFNNAGTGVLTFSTTGGDTINGAGTLVVQPNASGFLICTASGFVSIGALVGALSIAQGGTGATTANGALTNFGGTATGVAIFTAPSTAAVVALLGLSGVNITEMTISTDLALSTSSGNTAFICTAALTLTLPLTTSLTTQFSFIAFAQGGDVILAPQATDAINDTSVGTNLTLPEGASAFVFTDADGNWWATFLSLPLSGGTINGTLDVVGALTVGGDVNTSGTIHAVEDISTGGVLRSTGAAVIGDSATIVSGGLSVTGGAAINGGVIVATGGLLVSTTGTITQPGTAGNQVVNFSQFASTLAAVGIQSLPGGYVEQWGTGSTTTGVGAVVFATNFATACLNVDLTIVGGSGAGSVHALFAGTLGVAGFPVYGDVGESLTFNYRAIGY
jgi:hypothetical protein